MQTGYIKLWRKIDHSATYSDPEALLLWIRLLLDAAFKPTQVFFNGEKVDLKKGQVITKRKILAVRTGISESKIFRLLRAFEKCNQIEQQANNRKTLITIVNYEFYQESKPEVNNRRTASEQPVNNGIYEQEVKKKDLKTPGPIRAVAPTPDSRIRILIDSYHKALRNRLGEFPSGFNGGAAAQGFKKLLQSFEQPQIAARFIPWFQSTDSHIVKRCFRVEDFFGYFNRLKDGPLLAYANGNGSGRTEEEEEALHRQIYPDVKEVMRQKMAGVDE